MKIALINPPTLVGKYDGTDYVPVFNDLQHAGIAYISGMLEKNHYDVTVIECDCNILDVNDLCTKIEEEKYDVIGISVYYYNYINVGKLLIKLKMKAKWNPFIFVGGYYPSRKPEQIMRAYKNINCCIVGEGELTILELVNRISKNELVNDIRGIAYLKDNIFFRTESRPQEKDLHKYDYPKISYISNKKTAGVVTSRGCFGQCSFCAIHSYSRELNYTVRFREAEYIVSEIETLVNKGVEQIQILDDNFLCHIYSKEKTIFKFCSLIKEKGIKIKFHIYLRTQEILKGLEELKALKSVGLESVFVGVESFVDRQLELYNKQVTASENIEAVKILNDLKITYTLGLIFFDPYLTLEELDINLKTIQELKTQDINHDLNSPISTGTQLSPIPDTKLYDILNEKGILNHSRLGFSFVNEEVNRYFINLEEWQERVSKIFYKLRKLIYETNNVRLYEIKKELLKLDVRFLRYMISEITNDDIRYSEWYEKLDCIEKELLKERYDEL